RFRRTLVFYSFDAAAGIDHNRRTDPRGDTARLVARPLATPLEGGGCYSCRSPVGAAADSSRVLSAARFGPEWTRRMGRAKIWRTVTCILLHRSRYWFRTLFPSVCGPAHPKCV